MMRRRTLLLSSLGLGAVAAASACTPGAGTSDSEGAAPAEPASTELSTDAVTLALMSTPESGVATEATIEGFQQEHTNITVEYSQTSYEDYNQSVNLNLSGDQSPDIALLNAVANTVKNDLVLPLDDYAELYGWTDFFSSTQLDQWRVAEDGSTLGAGGTLYAAPAGFSLVGLFYNKKLAAELGIEPPTTLDEFETALGTATSGGELAIQLGNAEGHASFIVQLLSQGASGAEAANTWAFGHPSETFDTDANTTAVETLLAWNEAGHLGDATTVNGTNLQGAVDNFLSGEGVFFVDGIWDAGKIGDGLGADVGFVPFPGEQVTAIGTSVAYAISSQSENPDEAAAFLDYLRTPEASAQQFAQGFMPNDPAAADPQPDTVQADIVEAWTTITDADGLVAFFNNATATMNDTLTAGTQQVIAGKMNAEAFIASVQEDWEGTHGSR